MKNSIYSFSIYLLLSIALLFMNSPDLYAQRWVWDTHAIAPVFEHETELLNENIQDAFYLPAFNSPAFVRVDDLNDFHLIYDSDASPEVSNWTVDSEYFNQVAGHEFDRFNIEYDQNVVYFQYIEKDIDIFHLRCFSKSLDELDAQWVEVTGSSADIPVDEGYYWPPYAFYSDFNNDNEKEWLIASSDQVGFQWINFNEEIWQWQANEYQTIIDDSTNAQSITHRIKPIGYHQLIDNEGNSSILAVTNSSDFGIVYSVTDRYSKVFLINSLQEENPDIVELSGDTRELKNLCGYNPVTTPDGALFSYNGEEVFVEWEIDSNLNEVVCNKLWSNPTEKYGFQFTGEEITYFLTKCSSRRNGANEYGTWERWIYDYTLWNYSEPSWNFAFSLTEHKEELYPVKSFRTMTDAGLKDVIVIRAHQYEPEFGYSIKINYLVNDNNSGENDWRIMIQHGESYDFGSSPGDMFNWQGSEIPEVFYAYNDGPGIMAYDLENPSHPEIANWSDQLPWSLMTAGDFNGDNYLDLFFTHNRIFEADIQIGDGTPEIWTEYSPNLEPGEIFAFADYHNDGVMDIIYQDGESYYVKTFAGENRIYDGSDQPITFKLISTYPNPFNATLNVKYSLPYGSNGQISLINILGQVVTGPLPIAGNGMSTKSINAHNLSSGRYFLQIKNKKQTINRSVILLK